MVVVAVGAVVVGGAAVVAVATGGAPADVAVAPLDVLLHAAANTTAASTTQQRHGRVVFRICPANLISAPIKLNMRRTYERWPALSPNADREIRSAISHHPHFALRRCGVHGCACVIGCSQSAIRLASTFGSCVRWCSAVVLSIMS